MGDFRGDFAVPPPNAVRLGHRNPFFQHIATVEADKPDTETVNRRQIG
jgi:hypothetical protein